MTVIMARTFDPGRPRRAHIRESGRISERYDRVRTAPRLRAICGGGSRCRDREDPPAPSAARLVIFLPVVGRSVKRPEAAPWGETSKGEDRG